MFEEWRRRFSKKNEDEVEMKPFEETTGNPTTREVTGDGAKDAESAPQASISAKSDSVELRVMRPEKYEDVGSAAEYLLDGCTVVLNVEALERPIIVRMLDFLNGVTFCTDGEIKKLSPTMFIITPHANVDVSDI